MHLLFFFFEREKKQNIFFFFSEHRCLQDALWWGNVYVRSMAVIWGWWNEEKLEVPLMHLGYTSSRFSCSGMVFLSILSWSHTHPAWNHCDQHWARCWVCTWCRGWQHCAASNQNHHSCPGWTCRWAPLQSCSGTLLESDRAEPGLNMHFVIREATVESYTPPTPYRMCAVWHLLYIYEISWSVSECLCVSGGGGGGKKKKP